METTLIMQILAKVTLISCLMPSTNPSFISPFRKENKELINQIWQEGDKI